jgi:putative transposase
MQTVAQLLTTLGVIKSHSRRRCRTTIRSRRASSRRSYQTVFRQRFALHEPRAEVLPRVLFLVQRRASRLGARADDAGDRSHGPRQRSFDARQITLSAAYLAHLQRFVHREPRPQQPPAADWINPWWLAAWAGSSPSGMNAFEAFRKIPRLRLRLTRAISL